MGLTETDVDNIVQKLANWTPGTLDSEKAYEDSVYRHLNASFPKEKFERQYSRGKTRADIYVQFINAATVAVELKRDLQERGDYHRLVGQIYEYLTEWKVEVLVILCGDNDPAITKNVERFVAFMNDHSKYKVRFLHVPGPRPTSLQFPGG